ncbi:MAG: serine hydrolase [Flavobacteriales bacterium]|nr:serine hydrolase [Flavobacteriales bacterium]
MNKLFKLALFIVIIVNLFIILSGKNWLYKGIAITYLKGYTSSYIDDFIYFPFNKIEVGAHQPWKISKKYNKTNLPKFLQNLNDSLETTALMIIINDSIRYERYWDGYSSDSMSNSFSMSKSWVSTLVGVAIQEGKINSLDQAVCDFLPEFCNGKNSQITIRHLLTMSSGLNWKEDYHNPLGQTAEAYYGNNIKKLTMSLKAIEDPGKIFKYHSSCTQLLTFVLESATKKTISKYASEKLWVPIGAKHPALWSTDSENGDEKSFCCINSNARDFARLGRLYLSFGSWNGAQILDSSYVLAATSSSNLLNKKGDKNTSYGYQWWVANYKKLKIYYARGLWGQYVICIPAKNMIIVRLGKKGDELLQNGHHKDFYLFVEGALKMYP